MFFKAPVVLITGVRGLIGSALAEWILENHPECYVVGVDDESGGVESNITQEMLRNTHFTYIPANLLTQPKTLSWTFDYFYQPDYVFHFAAYAAEGLSPFVRKFNYENNVVATAAVINECIKHGVKRLVYTSSTAVYGRKQAASFTEDMLRQPIDPYGVAKAACEMDIEIAGEQHGLDYCILRPHNVYGPGQNIWDPYRNVLGIWMCRTLNNLPIRIYGDGSQRRAFTYIEDILEPLWNAAVAPEASQRIINLGNTPSVSILGAAQTFEKVVGRKVEIEYCEPRYEALDTSVDGSLSEKLLGFKFRTNLSRGLQMMWTWAKEEPPRVLQKGWAGGYEIDKGIYSYWK